MQNELEQIAVLYERIADGKASDHLPLIIRAVRPKLKQLARFSAAGATNSLFVSPFTTAVSDTPMLTPDPKDASVRQA